MTVVSHLDIFYDTRFSLAVTNSGPSNNPNTGLTEVPKAAIIHFEDGPERYVDSMDFDAPNGKGYETAQFLIGRAMMDPDAVVEPT
jgi:hypothetical protein